MSWTFTCAEASPGQYLCTGRRDSAHTVKLTCGEKDTSRIFELAFDLELQLGTDPHPALFQVVKGAKPNWRSQYDCQAFGSWVVESAESNNNRIVFDGKEFWLAVYSGNEEPILETCFRTVDDLDRRFFQVVGEAPPNNRVEPTLGNPRAADA